MLTLGLTSFSEEVFQDALTAMQPVIVKATKAAEVRVAAVDALSMMCFLAAEGPEETLEVMHLLKKTFGKGKLIDWVIGYESKKERKTGNNCLTTYSSSSSITYVMQLHLRFKQLLFEDGLFCSQQFQLGNWAEPVL